MTDILQEIHNNILTITFNRIKKHNAFDDIFLTELNTIISAANSNPLVYIIVLKANGKSFSAGADLNWMQKMAAFSEKENIQDANILANLMYNLYNSPKPTIALVNGGAYGGGAGIVAACDIAIASIDAKFSFSEVKLNLIPAVISPYVIKAIGQRVATCLFMSGEIIDAKRALELNLIHTIVNNEEFDSFSLNYINNLVRLEQSGVRACKALVRTVAGKKIDENLSHTTATLIAKRRSSPEGKKGINTFLAKQTKSN